METWLISKDDEHELEILVLVAGRRSLQEVKQRGGWRADKSVTRYDKHARLADQMQKKTAAQVRHFEACETQLGGLFQSRGADLPPCGLTRR